MNRARLLMCAAAMLAAACQDRQSPPTAPSFLIQDAAHGGNPHFYWLPPMTRQPSFTGTFDGTLAPVVEISELGGVTGCSNHVVTTFTTTTGPGSEMVRVDLVNQLYIVNWHTKAFNLNTACTYRIRFLVAGLELGIADVDVVATGAQLKRVDTNEFVPLLDDGTLSIKARVEFGAVTFAVTGDATACRPGRDCGEAVVTPVQGQDMTVLTVGQTAGLFIPAGALAEQVVVLIESRSDRPCIPVGSMALPQFPDCYRYEVNPTASIERLAPRQVTEGEIHNSYRFQTDVIVGMCVEVGNLTPGQQARLDLFRFDPVAGTVNTLPDAPARFLPCDPNFGTTPPVGASGVLQRGWRVVMNGLHALVGARTAFASTSVVHVGLGGSTCCTSYFTWGVPGVLFPNLPDTTFVVPVGSTVVPSVVVKDSGGTPIAGAMVTFAAASGTIIGTNPVTTGADGIAQVSWQLPSAPGLHTLTASTPGAAESPRHFLATGTAPNSNLLIDTGPGGSSDIGALGLFSSGSTTCSPQPACATSFQFLAGQFTLAREARLESVQGWMSGGGGSIDVMIRAENGGIPGSSIFSKTYTQGIQSGFDWVVFLSYDVVLPAGTYWLSFEPVANSGFEGGMSGGAAAPLPNYAFHSDGNNRWINFGFFGPQPGLGMRISEAALTPAERIADLRTTVSDLDLPTGSPARQH
jgi:hypothetical protein